MLITNGTKTRNIDPQRLPEYTRKGYKEVKPAVADNATTEPPAKPKSPLKGKK